MKKQKSEVQVVEYVVRRHVVLEQKKCRQCGVDFMGSKRKEYCSRICVQRAGYARNPAMYRESRMRSYRKKREAEGK